MSGHSTEPLASWRVSPAVYRASGARSQATLAATWFAVHGACSSAWARRSSALWTLQRLVENRALNAWLRQICVDRCWVGVTTVSVCGRSLNRVALLKNGCPGKGKLLPSPFCSRLISLHESKTPCLNSTTDCTFPLYFCCWTSASGLNTLRLDPFILRCIWSAGRRPK